MIIALRSNFQKVPFYLAIFAWLMQLSVFITPVLLKHPELGFGVCEELAVVIDHAAMNHSEKSPSASDHASHAITTQPDAHQSHQKSIHSPFANCKFCLVFGHNFDPMLLACLIVLLVALIGISIRPQAFYQFKLHQKLHLLLFQNRAPPASAVFTPLAVI